MPLGPGMSMVCVKRKIKTKPTVKDMNAIVKNYCEHNVPAFKLSLFTLPSTNQTDVENTYKH